MNDNEQHEDDLASRYRSFAWLLVVAIALLGIALLLRQYDVF